VRKTRKKAGRSSSQQKLPLVLHAEVRKEPASPKVPDLPVEEVLSFLKETRGAVSWTDHEMAKSLKISPAAAKQALVILELQGYVKKSANGDNAWLTTLNGESLSGSVAPRFTAEKVNEALSSLADRIRKANADSHSKLRVTEAVAFGDFLSKMARVQAADVGIQFEARGAAAGHHASSTDEQELMKHLRAGSSMLKLRPYQSWMSSRSHRSLLRSD
jgi:predicted ArsR family transcriptional regulator